MQKISNRQTQPAEDSFPLGIFIGVIVAFVVLAVVVYYTQFMEHGNNEQIDISETLVKSKPERHDLQQQLSDIITSNLSDDERLALLNRLKGKYFDNTYVVYLDVMDSVRSVKQIDVYFDRLRVFTQHDAQLKMTDINVESVTENRDSIIVTISEKMEIK